MAKEKKNETRVEANAYTQAASANRGNTKGVVNEAPPPFSTETETTVFPDLYPRHLIRAMSDEEIAEKSEAVLRAMTFSEKCLLLHGQDMAPKVTGCSSFVGGVPRLGIPVMFQHDGPSGVNSVYETTHLPVELVAGCTFSPEMAWKYGKVLGQELVSVGSNWQLGCQFDLTRHPFWMRSRDTYGEDYYLTGQMAAAETAGLQAQGAGAMAKHMGAYCTNGDNLLSSWVDEQTLHTAYLYPFEMAAKKARLASIMTTYTRLNGYYTASNTYMQKDVARDLWGWKGNMTTDAGGNQEVSVHLGTDNEMGYRYNGEPGIRSYLAEGLMTMEDVDAAVRHILWGYGVAGYLGLVEVDPLTGLAKYEPGRTDYILLPDTYWHDRVSGLYQEHNDIAVEIAEKGQVLLKNENGALPLTPEKLKKGVALIGYGAKHNIEGTGFERSFGVLEYMRTPGAALKEICDCNLTTEVLEDKLGYVIPGTYLYQEENGEAHGLKRTYGIRLEDCYVPKFTGFPGMPPMEDGEDAPPPPPGMGDQKPKETSMEGFRTGSLAAVDEQLEFLAEPGFFTGGTAFPEGAAYTWSGYLAAPESGEYTLALHGIGGDANLRVYDGDQELLGVSTAGMGFGHGPQWEFDEATPEGMTSGRKTVTLEAGKRYRLLITAKAEYAEKDLSLRLAWITPGRKKADYEAAIAAAKNNPTVIYFAREGVLGHGGMNFTKLDLEVNELPQLLAVQKAAKEAGNTFIVVMYSRSAFALDGSWCDDTDALIASFYPGQGGNTALARLLTGKTNFSGKLCVTIPERTEDTCVSVDEETSKERRGNLVNMWTPATATFTEKLDFGYRWNLRTGVKPGFAFGHGLSYTSFAYGGETVRRTAEGLSVTVNVTNTGAVPGDEIVQVYLGPGSAPEHVFFAQRQLAGFARTGLLEPGETKTMEIPVPERMLSYWDEKAEIHQAPDGSLGKWVIAQGQRQVFIGAASDDIRAELTADI